MLDPHPLYIYDGHINTWSGKKINLRFPDPDEIVIEDIAMGLSNICHFGGQISPFFSVAQHCHLAACLAPDELKPATLLHDASEAYLGDVVKPLKVILGEPYQKIERNFMEIIYDKFKIPIEHLALIKPFDKDVQEREFEYFFKGNKKAFGELLFFNPMWDQKSSFEIFMRAFTKYFKFSNGNY